MQLTPIVHLVGSGLLGTSLTDEYDCNVYLIDCGTEFALVDAGAGYRTEPLVVEIKRSGFEIKQITTLLLTHEHADHSGGVAALRDITGATVVATEAAATAVRDAARFNRGLGGAKRAGAYPQDYIYRAFEADRIVGSDDRIQVGNYALKVIRTPGHCAGHCSFILEAEGLVYLFSGDAILPGGQIVLQAIDDCSVSESVNSIEALGALRPDLLLAGHLAPVLRQGYRHIEFALARVRRGHLPQQMFIPDQS